MRRRYQNLQAITADFVQWRARKERKRIGWPAPDNGRVDDLNNQLSYFTKHHLFLLETKAETVPLLREATIQLNIRPETCYSEFADAAKTIFRNGITWSRVALLFAFVGETVAKCTRDAMSDHLNNLPLWLDRFIEDELQTWMKENGDWVSVCCIFKHLLVNLCFCRRNSSSTRKRCLSPSISTLACVTWGRVC